MISRLIDSHGLTLIICSVLIVIVLYLQPAPVLATCSLYAECNYCTCADTSLAGCRCNPIGSNAVCCYSYEFDYSSPCGNGQVRAKIREIHGLAGEDCCGGSCFTAGTKVATPGGEQVIEQVRVGDTVESFDATTGEVSYSKVGQNFTRVSDSYYVVKTESGRQIEVTGEHPLYTGTAPQPPKTLTQKLAQAWYELSTDIKAGLGRVREALVK